MNNNEMLKQYGENFTERVYITNPAIGRDEEIKQLILILLTPEKSGILVGKPGIGKTAIVEGLGYRIQRGEVPDALKGYSIWKLNTASLIGVMPGTNEPKITMLLNEIKDTDKLILFIDEIHTLIGTGVDGGSMDFAQVFKPGLDRGNIKMIGATTTEEYDRYILTDKAFVRRFQKVEVAEPTREHTIAILMGTVPKFEQKMGVKLKYTPFIQEKIMAFITDLTSEFKRVYEFSVRYPDVALTILQQAFSYAVFDNKKEVDIRDVKKAIQNTKLVYPDVIKKELNNFYEQFSDIYKMETPQRLKGE
jgi:ATP-dependent Clp protease ATP-binding subunit ClpA